MTTFEEVSDLEEQLRAAELAPDPEFFETVLAESVVVNHRPGKARVIAAHKVGDRPKFSRVLTRDLEILEHGPNAAVVTCKATFEGPGWTGTLKFMRVWLKTDGRWQIIAGSVSPS